MYQGMTSGTDLAHLLAKTDIKLVMFIPEFGFYFRGFCKSNIMQHQSLAGRAVSSQDFSAS